jgi:hypothetical protein
MCRLPLCVCILDFIIQPAQSQVHAAIITSLQNTVTEIKLGLKDSLKGVELHKGQLEMMGQCATSMVGMSDRLLGEAAKAGDALEQHKVGGQGFLLVIECVIRLRMINRPTTHCALH